MPRGIYTRRVRPVEDRFWPKVDRQGPIPPHCPELGPCWLWTGGTDGRGYGSFWFNGRDRKAHVVAYIITTGHEPSDDVPCILHRCDGGAIGCVRPSHLYAGTVAQNNSEMRTKGRHAYGGRSRVNLYPESRRHGDQYENAKLTDAHVREIRLRVMAGERRQDIAAEFGVSHQLVSGIVLYQRWKHVE